MAPAVAWDVDVMVYAKSGGGGVCSVPLPRDESTAVWRSTGTPCTREFLDVPRAPQTCDSVVANASTVMRLTTRTTIMNVLLYLISFILNTHIHMYLLYSKSCSYFIEICSHVCVCGLY